MATRPPNNNNQSDSSPDALAFVLVVAGVYIGIWACWHFGHTYIATGYGYLRYAQLYIFHALAQVADLPGLRSIDAWINGMCGPTGLSPICTRDFSSVQWDDIGDSSAYVNVAILIGLTAWCVRQFLRVNATHPQLRFVKKHDLRSFIDEQNKAVDGSGKALYPHLKMVIGLDLIDRPLDDPRFGMALTSRQFVVKHQLVAGWKEEPDGSWSPTVDRERAVKVFRTQLGDLWTSSAKLSVAQTLLVAIAMPRVAATNVALDDKEFEAAMAASAEMIRFCWAQFTPPAKGAKTVKGEDPFAWLSPTIDLTYPRQVIAQYVDKKKHACVDAVLSKHAFVNTVIFGLYTEARRLGVLPPADMRWLRFYDRALWHALQTCGRQDAFPEAAGVMGHFKYECRAGTAIVEPQLDKAVNALETRLANFKFMPADKTAYDAAAARQLLIDPPEAPPAPPPPPTAAAVRRSKQKLATGSLFK